MNYYRMRSSLVVRASECQCTSCSVEYSTKKTIMSYVSGKGT